MFGVGASASQETVLIKNCYRWTFIIIHYYIIRFCQMIINYTKHFKLQTLNTIDLILDLKFPGLKIALRIRHSNKAAIKEYYGRIVLFIKYSDCSMRIIAVKGMW